MKRIVAVLALALLAGCEMGVPGITCKASSECENGWCDRGICTECSPACTDFETCGPTGACIRAFASLDIKSPASGASVTAPFRVTVALAREGASTLAPPASVALSAKPANGAAESFTLAREGETLTYSASISPKVSGSYSLTASSTELALTSAAVSVTLSPLQCEPACSGLKDCIDGACVNAFEKIEITSPTNGASFPEKNAGVSVEARIVRAAKSSRAFPATVDVSGTSASGKTVSGSLTGKGDGTYSGSFAPSEGGTWELTASSTEVEAASEKVSIVVEYCPRACGTWEECASGACVPAFASIAISNPANGATVGGSVELRAVLTRRSGGTLAPPATVSLEVDGTAKETLTLAKDATKPLEYVLAWNPGEGNYTLKASTPAVALPSATVAVTVDKTAPTLTVTVLAPPSRKAWELDEKSATKDTEYKRNEKAKVKVESAAADIDPASVKIEVTGLSGGTVEVIPTACATQPASGYCGEAEVDLGNPALKMNAFRGSFAVKALMSDMVGNEGTGAGTIAVTRFKWKVDPGTSSKTIQAAPAVGKNGDVFVVTSTGKVAAISPDGTEKWSITTGGGPNASLGVDDVEGVETVFASGLVAGTGAVWAANASANGTSPAPLCSSGTQVLGAIAITEFMFDGDSSALVGAVAGFMQSSGSKVSIARPSAPQASACPSLSFTATINDAAGFAVRDHSQIILADKSGNLRAIDLIAGGPAASWAAPTGGLLGTNPIFTGQGIAVGGSAGVSGGLFRLSNSGADGVSTTYASPLGNAIGIATGLGNQIAVGSDEGHLFLADETFPSSGTLSPKMTLSGTLKAAPALGADKALYIASTDQKLFVRDLQGNALWEAELGSSSYSSPALDCARDSNGQKVAAPGVVYVGADDGFLYAFVTDSHGLDVDSPWPKFHRDPKNRANTGFPLEPFRCP